MKNIILAAIFLFSNLAHSALGPVKGKAQTQSTFSTIERVQTPLNQMTVIGTKQSLIETGNANLLLNPGFEATTFSTNWTASGGSFVVATGSDIGTGAKAASFDASASSQTVTSDAVTIPAGYYSNSAEVSCSFKTDATDYLLEAYDGTNVLVSQTLLPSTTYKRQIVNFVMPSSGTIALRVSSGSNASAIYFDDCYVGPATNIGLSAQATFYAGQEQTGASGCTYLQNTSTGTSNWVDLGSGSGCNAWTTQNGSGAISSVGTNSLQFTLSNMPAGQYMIQYIGTFANTGTGTTCLFRLSDSTNTYQVQGTVGGAGQVNVPSLGFHVNKTSVSSVTYKIQSADDGTTTCGLDNGSNKNAAIKIWKFPTSDQVVSSNPLTFYPEYSAKVSSAGVVSDESGGDWLNGNCAVANTSDYTCTFNTGIFGSGANCTATGLDTTTGAPIVKVLTAESTSSVVMKTYNDAATATAFAFRLNCQSVAAASSPVPIFVGSVTSGAGGALRIESAELNCDASSSITRQTSTWVSSIANISAGGCGVTFAAGVFAATPYCVATPTTRLILRASDSSSTATDISCLTDAGANCTSYDFKLLCIGSK